MAFRDGRAATVDDGHELRLWDVSQPDTPHLLTTKTLPQLEERSFSQLAYSPDGRRLVLSGISRGPMFLDVSTPTRPQVLPDVPALAKVQELTYTPEGGRMMTTGRETVCSAPGLMETSKPGRNTSDARTEEVPR
jgi:WD40 repeat protein